MADTDNSWFPLENKLRQDDDGSEREALIDLLEAQSVKIKRNMDAGVPPNEFSDLEAVYKALEAAVLVVNMIWRRYHPG